MTHSLERVAERRGASQQMAVLFIGRDNIRRSPAAQAMAETEARRRGEHRIRFDSAGTTWRYAGERATGATLAAARALDIDIEHTARRVGPGDFSTFDLLIVMDLRLMSELERLRSGMELRQSFYMLIEPNQIQLLRRWDPYAMPGDEDLSADIDEEAMFSVLARSIPPLVDHLQELITASP